MADPRRGRLCSRSVLMAVLFLAGATMSGCQHHSSSPPSPPSPAGSGPEIRLAVVGTAGLDARTGTPAPSFVMWGGHPDAGLAVGGDAVRYCKFGEAVPPASYRGTAFGYFEKLHPSWIEYRSDRSTPAWYTDSNTKYVDYTSVPVDMTNPAVRSYIITSCVDTAVREGYDGVGFDHATTLNRYGRSGHFDDAGKWIQQYSGTEADPVYRQSMMAAFSALASESRAQAAILGVSHFLIAINDPPLIGAQASWWGDLVGSADVVFDEHGYTNGGTGSARVVAPRNSIGGAAGGGGGASAGGAGAAAFATIVADQQMVLHLGHRLIVNALLPYSPSPSGGVQPADARWVVATYLLIAGPGAYLTPMRSGVVASGHTLLYDTGAGVEPGLYGIALGSPIGAAAVDERGVYRRAFQVGLVLVNPTNRTETESVTAGWEEADGGPVPSTISVAADDAAILLQPHAG